MPLVLLLLLLLLLLLFCPVAVTVAAPDAVATTTTTTDANSVVRITVPYLDPARLNSARFGRLTGSAPRVSPPLGLNRIGFALLGSVAYWEWAHIPSKLFALYVLLLAAASAATAAPAPPATAAEEGAAAGAPPQPAAAKHQLSPSPTA